MEQSVESNFFKKFKAIGSLPILCPYFRFFFKKGFLRKSGKPGHGNQVLITSIVQVELSKLSFNFDDIRTYFLQVLRNCRQITGVTLKACVRYFLSNFYFFTKWCLLFFHQMMTVKNVFNLSKKLFSFSRYSDFCIFSSSFPRFSDSKGQMEVE